MNVKKLSDTQASRGFRVLQYGASGKGKTYRTLTAVQFGPMFIIDCDGKLEAYMQRSEVKHKENIHYVVPSNIDEFLEAINFAIQDNGKTYATICIDTVTAWHSLAKNKLKDYKVSQINPAARSNMPASLDGTPFIKLGFDEYGDLKDHTLGTLDKLLSLKSNLIVNSHVDISTDPSGLKEITVGTIGSTGPKMPEKFQETHYLYTDRNGKIKIRGRRGVGSEVANSALDDEAFDQQGNFKVTDLSPFASRAYKLNK